MFTSCTDFSSDNKRLQEENDSLKLHIKKSETEMNEMLSILNTIEDDIRTIRDTENFIDIRKEEELSLSKRERIKNELAVIAETLKKNRQQLSELQKKLNTGNVRLSALQKTIDRLTADIDEKTRLIVKMQAESDRKDRQITQLTEQVEELHTNVETLKDVNESQSARIDDQDKALNTVYYCFGTGKELKEQNILTGGGLFVKSRALQGAFNKEYFIVADKRRLTAIPLYASKAKIKTSHPEESYSFFKDSDGNLTLEIKNTETFWSLSRYLVVEVK
jgi:predicted  nucleic acid-binding Zn-ribbon protein